MQLISSEPAASTSSERGRLITIRAKHDPIVGWLIANSTPGWAHAER